MSKLLRLKEWYSLEDAAKRLTVTMSEPIELNDIIQLVTEHKLPLSWYTRQVKAERVVYSTRMIQPILDKDREPYEAEGFWGDDEYISILEGPYSIDLHHNGAVKDWLLSHLTFTGGDLVSLDGLFLQDANGTYFRTVEAYENIHTRKNPKLYASDNYFPSAEFPPLSELGFIKADLEGFERSFIETTVRNEVTTKADKSLGARERETLLKMVIGMAVKGYGYDPKARRNPTAGEIASDLNLQGIPIDEDTVRKWLQESASILPTGTT